MKIVFSKKKSKKLKKIFDKEWSKLNKEHFGRSFGRWKKEKFLFKVVEGKEALGYVRGSVAEGVGKIDELIVAQKHRGKKIGSLLMAVAERWLRLHKAHKVFLTTGKNWQARKFYRKLGYHSLVILKDYYRGADFVLLEKELNSR